MTTLNKKGSRFGTSLSVVFEPVYTGPRPEKRPTEIITYQCENPDLSYEVYHGDDEDNAITIGPHVKRPTMKRRTLLPQAKLEDLHEYIPFENVFHVDQEDVDQFNTINSENVQELFDLMLKRHASLNIATEVAVAQVEAVMDKCLDSPIEADIDLPNLVDFVNQVDLLNFYLNKSNIDSKTKELVTEQAVGKLIGDWGRKTKSSVQTETFRRHREDLQNADVSSNAPFAVKRSRSG